MSRRASETSTLSKDSIPVLKARIKELEDQVCEYKRRLDDLRKAKHTTILKRQREVVNINAPNMGRRDSLSESNRIKELEAQIEEMALSANEAKMESKSNCGHEFEIRALRKMIEEVVGENAAMLFENMGLKEEISELQSNLSAKEASLCQREEELKIQVEQEWQLKYQEWMARTEQKLEELQQANNMMRTLLKKDRPTERDPTGQDHH